MKVTKRIILEVKQVVVYDKDDGDKKEGAKKVLLDEEIVRLGDCFKFIQ